MNKVFSGSIEVPFLGTLFLGESVELEGDIHTRFPGVDHRHFLSMAVTCSTSSMDVVLLTDMAVCKAQITQLYTQMVDIATFQ